MDAQGKSQANANRMLRAKVYRLNDYGKWDDQGTGHVTVDYMEGSEELWLFVIDEEDNETLLLHRISPDDIYRKQEDTIISWRDPEYSTELALSFQETAGCSYIWDNVCNVQRNLFFNSLNTFEESEDSYSVNQGNWGTSNRRKYEEEEVEMRLKKPRLVWSVELHQQFVSVVNELGIDKAVPKKILELMNVPGLKRENVARRLQKYRLFLRRLSGVSLQQGNSFVSSN